MLEIIQGPNFVLLQRVLSLATSWSQGNLKPPGEVFAIPFIIDGTPVGALVLPEIVERLRASDSFIVTLSSVRFAPHLSTSEARTAALEAVLISWRDRDAFACLKGWRFERYSVWGQDSHNRPVILMEIERSAAKLFGFRAYGCHVNGYVKSQDGSIRMWVGRRSPTKKTYPNMLDNMVGGGLPHGHTPLGNALKESYEEAGVTPSQYRLIKPVSFVSILRIMDGLVLDSEYIYDMEVPETWTPQCQDGEVAGFELMALADVETKLRNHEFVPESALVTIDFMIRHGYIDPSTEPDYISIIQGLRPPIPFPGPSFPISQ